MRGAIGLRLTLLEMWAPEGRYMGVVRTVGPVGVPDDVRKLPRLGALLAALWVMKVSFPSVEDGEKDKVLMSVVLRRKLLRDVLKSCTSVNWNLGEGGG